MRNNDLTNIAEVSALDYCSDKAAVQGTPGYYAVLFYPPPVRAALIALRALERELADIVELCTEHTVAQHKLAYWQQELLAGDSITAHPVTRALHEHASGILDNAAREHMLTATAQRISIAQMQDDSQIDQIITATAGTIALACARVTGINNAGAVEGAIAAERLRLLGLPRRAGLPAHSGIALNTLTACAVTPRQVDSAGNEPALLRLRELLLAQAFAATQHADMLIAQRRGYAATCLRITRCLLAANQRSDYVESGRLVQVAPLRLLWHAWRSRP